MQQFHENFINIQTAFYDLSYKKSIATQWNDAGFGTVFEFNLLQDYDGFLGIEMYNPRLYPVGCKNASYG